MSSISALFGSKDNPHSWGIKVLKSFLELEFAKVLKVYEDKYGISNTLLLSSINELGILHTSRGVLRRDQFSVVFGMVSFSILTYIEKYDPYTILNVINGICVDLKRITITPTTKIDNLSVGYLTTHDLSGDIFMKGED